MEKDPFFECLNSFERSEKQDQVAKKCKNAIKAGLNLIDKSIVHGLLMSSYANEKDFEKAQEEHLHAKETIGTFIGLSGQELQTYIHELPDEKYQNLLLEKVDHKENIAKASLLNDILLYLPLYPISFRNDVTDQEKINSCLESWSNFPQVSSLYLLLGDLWATDNVNYAIKCLKIVKEEESPSSGSPSTIVDLVCRYKLGNLYRENRDITSAIKEFKEVLSASSHPEWHTLSDFEKEIDHYWLSKAKKDLAEIEIQDEKDAKESKCFIATAVYGTPHAPEVQSLRKFRDECMLPKFLGRLFVYFYYKFSPGFASAIAKSRSIRRLTNWVILKPILWIIKDLRSIPDRHEVK